MKTCKTCGETKSFDLFHPHVGNKTDGRRGSCRVCVLNSERARYSEDERRERHLKKVFKRTLEDYNKMFVSQNGQCRTCKRTSETWLVVDHDHAHCPGNRRTCGKCVRGLLCRPCNTALGQVNDNRETLQAMIEYLGGLNG